MHKTTLFSSWRKSEVGQAQILAALVFLFLIPTTVIIAQNSTAPLQSNISIEGGLVGLTNGTVTDTNDSRIPPEALTTIVETLQDENQSASATQQFENDSNGDLESLQEIINSTENPENESVAGDVFTGLGQNETIPQNQTENTTEMNVSQEAIGPQEVNDSETYNETQPEIIPEENVTESNTTEIMEPVVQQPVDVVQQLPIITVLIDGPDRIIRGEEVVFTAEIYNEGNVTAKNLSGVWLVPDGFSIQPEQEGFFCGDLEPGSSCQVEVSLSTSLQTEIGSKDMRVRVRYG